ncbi:MAG: ribonuclease H [Natronomonas sp.]|uniref:ribonuclease HI n=1 Tax=Natronomonas sp. TaxID=2184060 RepID=UPI0028707F52|nr:ribonuclease H [Natronomonas sp.]MDR9381258.1 ribonuclease H [Natronomonas sp.]MDR9429656.1 ribonuclease H [Natronomonas sp.]
MAAYRRPALRNLFDESPTPHIAHPPHTHCRDLYIATDGSYRHDGDGGLGVVIETRDGESVARLSVPDSVPNNNVAEYRALHLGLDVLAVRAPQRARVGILVDHDDLAANVNRAILAARGPDARPPHPVSIPEGTARHWRGIRARIAGFDELRAARIDSGENPAHPLANTPDQYAHVNREQNRCVRPSIDDASEPSLGEQYPPPSRANRDRSGARGGEPASD